ncbi:hypothetical protein [Bacillus thuringiensis]|uniref:hypothetical protein n=1 Tax=Bacillus thuringiensis TaxID=1428 RepID=UPI0034583F3D
MNEVLYMAVHKETGEVLSGAKGQACFFDKGVLGRSIGQTSNRKGDYDVIEFNSEEIIARQNPKEFTVTEIHGSNWNDEAHYELKTPAGGFSIGSLSECPEDASLERDLSFAYDVVDLMKAAFEAGKRGDIFIVETEDDEDEE